MSTTDIIVQLIIVNQRQRKREMAATLVFVHAIETFSR